MRKIHQNISTEALEARTELRERIELLRSRVGLLSGTDKLLMTMYFENGNSFRQIALLSGVSEASISRRVKKLTRRLLDGEYIICLRNCDSFSGMEMGVAKDYFLKGLSIKRIALKRGWTYYRVHKTVKGIQQRVAEIQSQPEKC